MPTWPKDSEGVSSEAQVAQNQKQLFVNILVKRWNLWFGQTMKYYAAVKMKIYSLHSNMEESPSNKGIQATGSQTLKDPEGQR